MFLMPTPPAVDAVFRFLLFDCTLNNGWANLRLGKLEWMVGATSYPTSNMTSNTAPSPLVASASTEQDPAWHGFDGDFYAYWASTAGSSGTGWLKIDLGEGNGIVPTSAKITVKVSGSSCATESPKDFTFEGSETGSFSGEETVFKTVTGETGWSCQEIRTYTF